MTSISDALQQTLDLIGSESTNDKITFPAANFGIDQQKPEPKTASSILLEDRKKLKRKMDEISSTDFSAALNPKPTAQKPFTPQTMYFNQIANSEIGETKHWHSSSSSKRMKSSMGKDPLITIPNKVLAKKAKGADYADRYNNKASQRMQKQQLRNKLKGT